MKGLTTNTGLNWLGFLILIYEGISPMPDGAGKQILTGLVLTAAAIIAFITKGSGLDKEQADRILENSSIEDVLKEGRDEEEE